MLTYGWVVKLSSPYRVGLGQDPGFFPGVYLPLVIDATGSSDFVQGMHFYLILMATHLFFLIPSIYLIAADQAVDLFLYFAIITVTKKWWLILEGSGCGSVGRAVAYNTRCPLFASSHRQILHVLSVCNCIEKTKMNNKKRLGILHLKKKQWLSCLDEGYQGK